MDTLGVRRVPSRAGKPSSSHRRETGPGAGGDCETRRAGPGRWRLWHWGWKLG